MFQSLQSKTVASCLTTWTCLLLQTATAQQPSRAADLAPTALAACAPGVGELAYDATVETPSGSNADVFVVCTDGSNRRRLTTGVGYDGSPAWSPDGRHIAFISDRDAPDLNAGIPGLYLYVMDDDGSNVRRVVSQFASSVTWSPDGRRLAFVSVAGVTRADSMDVTRWPEQRDIFLVDVSGDGLTNLTSAAGSDNFPAWSPDGQQVAFSSRRVAGEAWTEIYVINADGTATRRLTFNVSGEPGCCEDAYPRWAPDSSWIAFISKRDGNSEIYKMRRDGSEQMRLTSDVIFDGFPSWSPDGADIAFERHRAAPSTPDGPPPTPATLYLMRADGTGRRDLGVAGTRPDWRP